MLRYLRGLEGRDLSLTHSMIPLGSCTMKLNAAAEMLPVTWPEFGRIHPCAPADQTQGYAELTRQLTGSISEAALSFMVHEPSGIIDVSRPTSFLSRPRMYRIIFVSE